jgi:hypothetical protein
MQQHKISHAAMHSNDLTSPPTYDFTSISSIFNQATSFGLGVKHDFLLVFDFEDSPHLTPAIA